MVDDTSAIQAGHVLVVDDNKINRLTLERTLQEQGHTSTSAENGRIALQMLGEEAFDVVLLDIEMPEMDGYETLEHIKNNSGWRHIPVIVISAVEEMDSVLRCIEMGAADYLPKPFNPALLAARLNASLANKRLRDLELEYLEQVSHVVDAAGQVESGAFDLTSLDGVSERDDALGLLARMFRQMATEVKQREDRLKQQVKELRIQLDVKKVEKEVTSITETAYFKNLSKMAREIRGELFDDADE